jgi:predicted enzyme related to lactoylglutathione lyase
MNETSPVTVELRSVVLDCPDPPALARFYGELLGGRVVADPRWSEVHVGHLPFKLAFQYVERYTAPQWPDGEPQQLHLDLTVPDLAAASTRAVELGGRVLQQPVAEEQGAYQVHADPSGHPFCFVIDRRPG